MVARCAARCLPNGHFSDAHLAENLAATHVSLMQVRAERPPRQGD